MSFHKSTCDIHLNNDDSGATHLVAICNNEWGCGLTSDILLDDCLGNQDGHLSWGGQNFTRKARNVSISREGPDRQPVLHAELENHDGDYIPNDVNLGDHIRNINGELMFDW